MKHDIYIIDEMDEFKDIDCDIEEMFNSRLKDRKGKLFIATSDKRGTIL